MLRFAVKHCSGSQAESCRQTAPLKRDLLKVDLLITICSGPLNLSINQIWTFEYQVWGSLPEIAERSQSKVELTQDCDREHGQSSKFLQVEPSRGVVNLQVHLVALRVLEAACVLYGDEVMIVRASVVTLSGPHRNQSHW